MSNPFTNYRPIENTDMWFGCKTLFDELSESIMYKTNTCIMGVQGSGKTSLLRCFFTSKYREQLAVEKKTIICDADMSTQKDGDAICNYLVDRIRFSVQWFLESDSCCQRILNSIDSQGNCTPCAKLQNVIDILVRYGYFVVIVMDAFENFTSSPTITMEHHDILRSLIEADKLQCIVATDYDLTKDSLPANVKGSYLIQKFTKNIYVPTLPGEDAIKLISQLQQGEAVQITTQVMVSLVYLSGGIPLLLRYAAGCAYDSLRKNNGNLISKEIIDSTYEKCKPIMASWCSALTPSQMRVLSTLSTGSSDKEFTFYNFDGDTDDQKSAVSALIDRGMLVSYNENERFTVRINSLVLQRFCKEGLANNTIASHKNSPEQLQGTMDTHGTSPSQPTIIVESGGQLVLGGTVVTGGNFYIQQGLSVSDVLSLLGKNDTREMFAAGLAEQLRAKLSSGSIKLLPRNTDSIEEYEQYYDKQFDEYGQRIIQDVQVDETEDLTVTDAEIQTLDARFAEARKRCRPHLSDTVIEAQSARCQFYLKLSVVVEDALAFPGIRMDDFSPQLVLYGKTLEQALRDNFFPLFHMEPELSVYDTYYRGVDPTSPDVFANINSADQTYIGNYRHLILAERKYLSQLCRNHQIDKANTYDWWDRFQCDINTARDIRNMADHADPTVSPDSTKLDAMCNLLIGAENQEGILSRALVGSVLSQRVLLDQQYVGKTCRIICTSAKQRRGLQGKTCDGDFLVKISPRRLQDFLSKNVGKYSDFDFTGAELLVKVVEFRVQDNCEFLSAEIVNCCTQ